MQQKKVSIVIPVYNESSNVHPLLGVLDDNLPTEYEFEVVFVDDGSVDGTLEILKQATFREKKIGYLSFSSNFGHQNALKAGLDIAGGDCVITMDGDLQHPPELVPEMLDRWEEGYDVVYTHRRDDKRQVFVKRCTARWFYRAMRSLSGMPIEQGIADFRLLDRRVADVLIAFQEPDLFLRGIVKWMGFRQYAIDYTPGQRFSGQTKYSGRKMLKLALQGITSFSVKPLYVSIILGILFFFLSLAYIPYILWCVYHGQVVPGWASIVITIMFFGGLQMLLLGITGIYIGKIFLQTKQRPGYIIKETNMTENKFRR